MFEFLAAQRGDRKVVRISDRESGLSARTIRRRVSSVSGFYAYLVARGDTSVTRNPVPRGLTTRRERSRPRQGVPLVRNVKTLPRVLAPVEVDALLGALRTQRDRAMVEAMVLGGLRRCEVLGLRLGDVRVGERQVFIADGKGGRQRLIPMSNRFFATLGRYLDDERPKEAATDRVFVVLKGPRRGRAVVGGWAGRDHRRRPATGRAVARHLSRAASHLSDPAARGGDVVGGVAGPGRSRLDRNDPGVSASRRRLARRRVPQGGRSDRGATRWESVR